MNNQPLTVSRDSFEWLLRFLEEPADAAPKWLAILAKHGISVAEAN